MSESISVLLRRINTILRNSVEREQRAAASAPVRPGKVRLARTIELEPGLRKRIKGSPETLKIPSNPGAISQDSAWLDEARCAGMASPDFFADAESEKRLAKAICDECPARLECLAAALLNHESRGVWGGLDARERARLYRIESRS